MVEYRDTDSPEAFRELYLRHIERASAYVRRHLRRKYPAICDDVVQEAFTRMHERRAQFIHDETKNHIFIAWFYTVLSSVVIDAVRSERRRQARFEKHIEDTQPVEATVDADLCEAATLLEKFEPHDREMVRQVYIEQVPMNEVASQHGVKYTTFIWRLQQILGRVRHSLVSE